MPSGQAPPTNPDLPATPIACPRCRRPPINSERCASCGLVLTGERVRRLRAIVERLDAIARQQFALQHETDELRREHAELLLAIDGESSTTAARPRPAPESRPEVVRDVLLWLGSALLAVAALIFALFAWRRLDDGGRAALLVAMTVLAALAAGATFKRLPATAEALGGLTLALFLVDWFALRRGGVAGGLPATLWWSIGTAMAAGLATAAAPWLRIQAVAAAMLIQVAAVLALTHVADEGWALALGLALVAALLAAGAGRLWRNRAWLAAAVVLGGGAALMEAAALSLVGDAFVLGNGTVSAPLAAVLAAMALAPAGAALTVGPGSRARRDTLVATGAGCLLGAVTMLLAAAWTQPTSLLAAVAVLGAAGIALALLLPEAVRPGCLYAAAAAVGLGVLRLLEPVAEAVATPLSWLADPWLADPWEAVLSADAGTKLGQARSARDLAFGAAVIALLALAAAGGLLIAHARGRRLVPLTIPLAAGTAAVVAVVVTTPLAAGWPIWGATAATAAGAIAAMAGAATADRRRLRFPSLVLGVAAAVLGAVATGWALATESGSLAFPACLVVAAAAATGWSRTTAFRQAFAAAAGAGVAGGSAAVAVSAGASTAPVGLVIAVAGGTLLVAGALGRRRHPEGLALEATGAVAMTLGTILSAATDPWLAVALTVSTVCLIVAGNRPGRGHSLLAGAATAVAATWAWLAVLDVTLVEAYTLPAAAVVLGAGFTARRRLPAVSSWTAFGPGLAIGLVPSVALVIAQGGLARPLAVTAGALLALLAGARTRLQAPLVLGAGTLLAIGLDALVPVAAQVPRWAVIGSVGLLLLWLGATAEHRMTQLRELGRRFRELEPDGPLGKPA